METYSAEKFACWRFLRHIGCKQLTAKAENTPARDSTPELLMDQIKGNTAQFPPDGLSTAPAAAAQHLRCQNAR